MMYIPLILLCLFCSFGFAHAQHRRFEYKYSFKGPHLGDDRGRVFFWSLGGHALASRDQVRVTASLRSQKGWMWTKLPTTFDFWEVEITFRVTGRARVGADGLAFWFTSEAGRDGPVFGSSDYWHGLGVFFDSFDNDGQQNNPYILMMTNNKSKSYDHTSDGNGQQLGGCLRDFRNRPNAPKAKIRYYNGKLSLYFNNGVITSAEGYELCTEAENVVLPSRGYFGLSAATGGLADDHDVIAFLTTSLGAPPPEDRKDGKEHIVLSDEELEKLNQEFEQYSKTFEEQKETYSKEHPDPYEDAYLGESMEERNLYQILQGQKDILTTIRDLSTKFAILHESVQKKISALGQGPGSPPRVTAQGSLEDLGSEMHSVIEQQKQMMHKIEGIEALQRHQAASDQQQGGQSDLSIYLSSLTQSMKNVESSLDNLRRRQDGESQSPSEESNGCIPPMYFAIYLFAQLGLFIAYLVYKHKASKQKLF